MLNLNCKYGYALCHRLKSVGLEFLTQSKLSYKILNRKVLSLSKCMCIPFLLTMKDINISIDGCYINQYCLWIYSRYVSALVQELHKIRPCLALFSYLKENQRKTCFKFVQWQHHVSTRV